MPSTHRVRIGVCLRENNSSLSLSLFPYFPFDTHLICALLTCGGSDKPSDNPIYNHD